MQLARDLLALSVSEALDAVRLRRAFTIRQLAARAAVSQQTLIDLFKTETDWKLSTLVKCAAACEHDVEIRFVPRPRVQSAGAQLARRHAVCETAATPSRSI